MYDMYQEIILDYYRNPRNKGKIEAADAFAEDVNPVCGDKIRMSIKISGNKSEARIEDIKFDGEGCAISQSSASMLTEAVKAKALEEAAGFSKEKMLETVGIELSPSRVKCALLGLKVLKLALYNYIGKETS